MATATKQVKLQPVPTWKTVVTVLSLLFFFPLGIVLMFLWMRWPLWVKILLSAGVVIMIIPMIAILAAIVVLIINPLELTRRARDATRLSDLSYIAEAINITWVAAPNDPKTLCSTTKAPCEGKSNISDPNVKNLDGLGWIKADISKTKVIPPTSLMVDPVNDDKLYYRYCSDGKNWEIDTALESEKDQKYAVDDKGDNPNLYEIGSDLTVCK
ncbi:MAG: hypothetical protein WCV81_05855 [Microgenomates group bacterium]|jgi:hypothetical protein